MNAHHTQWDPQIPTNNQGGNALADYILDEPSIAVTTTPGLITHMNNNGITSTLDLTICSNNLLNKIETKALPGHGSDHRPILTRVNITPDTTTNSKRPKWKLDHKKWAKHSMAFNEKTSCPLKFNYFLGRGRTKPTTWNWKKTKYLQLFRFALGFLLR